MATTYKYQQNLWEGSSAGYVKYNITPDFGTVLAGGHDGSLGDPCEKFTITGKFYSGLWKSYGLVARLQLTSSSHDHDLGSVAKTVSKGSSATFTIECEITQEIIDLLKPTERGFSAYLTFLIADESDLQSGALTNLSESQKLSLLQYRLPPVVNGVTFSDSTGALEHFGGIVVGKTDLTATLDVTLDPLDTSVTLDWVCLYTNQWGFGPFNWNIVISGNSAYFGVLDIADKYTGTASEFWLDVCDNKNNVGTYAGGAFTTYPYTSPKLTTSGSAELAERYEVSLSDEGEETAALSDSGVYLWANFTAAICAVNGKNAWTITRSYAEYGYEPTHEAVVYSGTDGEALNCLQDQTVFPRGIEFSAAKRYTVRLALADFFETVTLEYAVEKAGGYFNIEKGGVAVGMRANGTESKPMFESAYPFYPYGGIEKCSGVVKEISLEPESKFALYGESSTLCLRTYGNIVQLIGEVTPTAAISGSTTEYAITEIPAEYAPKHIISRICQGSGTNLWVVRVYPADSASKPCKVTFGRYRNSSSYSTASAGSWLPFETMWIAGDAAQEEA